MRVSAVCAALLVMAVLLAAGVEGKGARGARRRQRSGKETMELVADIQARAVQERQRGKFQHARELFEEALVLAPNHARLHYELGTLLMRMNRMASAIRELKVSVQQEPHIAESRVSLAIALMQVHAFSSAATQLETAASLPSLRKSRGPIVHELWGTALKELGAYSSAARQFKRLLKSLQRGTLSDAYEVPPQQMEQVRRAAMGLGHSYQGLQQYRKAAAKFRRACALRSAFDCHNAAAAAFAEAGQTDDAQHHYNEALRRGGATLAAAYGESAPQLLPRVADGTGLEVRQLSASPAPTVLTADGFITAQEAAHIRRLFDEKHTHVHSTAPLVCFSRGTPLAALVELLRDDAEASGLITDDVNSPVMLVNDTGRADGGASGDRNRVCFDTSRVGADITAGMSWSTSTFVYPGEDPLIDRVQKRLEQQFGLPRRHALATQLLKYAVGEEYGAHQDCTLSLQPNQRAVTALVYLTDVEDGGATEFPSLNVSVSAAQGRVAVFTSLKSNGLCDARSAHVGAKVNRGVKYAIQQWYLTTPVPGGHATRPGDKMAPYLLPSQPYVLCDRSGSCREYFPFDPSRNTHLHRPPAAAPMEQEL